MFILTPAFASKVKPLSSKEIKINKSQSVPVLTRSSIKSSSLLKIIQQVQLYFMVHLQNISLSNCRIFCGHPVEILIVYTIKIYNQC